MSHFTGSLTGRPDLHKGHPILQQRRRALERGARTLLPKETVTESELTEIAAPEPLPHFPNRTGQEPNTAR